MYCVLYFLFFFFKQKTAYEMRISDWSSDVCSSDLYALANLDLPPGDDAINRRTQNGTLEINTRLIACGSGGQNLRVCIGCRIVDQRLVGVATANGSGAVGACLRLRGFGCPPLRKRGVMGIARHRQLIA